MTDGTAVLIAALTTAAGVTFLAAGRFAQAKLEKEQPQLESDDAEARATNAKIAVTAGAVLTITGLALRGVACYRWFDPSA